MSAATAGMLKKINETLEKHFMGNVTKIDNGILKAEIIEFSFDDWFTADNGSRVIPHTLGVVPDEVIILPSHYNWDPIDQYDGYYLGYNILLKAERSLLTGLYVNEYSGTALTFYDADYPFVHTHSDIATDAQDLLTWGVDTVTIAPKGDIIFAPQSEITYKMLVIKHT